MRIKACSHLLSMRMAADSVINNSVITRTSLPPIIPLGSSSDSVFTNPSSESASIGFFFFFFFFGAIAVQLNEVALRPPKSIRLIRDRERGTRPPRL